MRDLTLKPEYSSSHALVVGINDYKMFPQLGNAVADANAVAEAMQRIFSFPAENVELLIDGQATKSKLLSSYFRFEKTADRDSRLLIFFAGHGVTRNGALGEVGFLIPHDGNPDDLSSLIRWEELILNSELIPAKHVFFVMDACYGGLVFNRAVSVGSVRFLKDMMIRPVRQALSSGKQDEPVSDGGGVRPKHSVFTSHFLNALDGGARSPEGHLTASGVMAYVYKQVANDIHSDQTPHYGFLTGDGDFVFDAPQLKKIAKSETSENDSLVTISALNIPEEDEPVSDVFAVVKQYLSDPKFSIPLHDYVVHHVRRVIVETSKEKFPVHGEFKLEHLVQRLQDYEKCTQELRRMLACISYWGTDSHRVIVGKAFSRVTDHIEAESGLAIFNSLRWYPIMLLCYSAGVAAVSNNRYDNLAAIFNARVSALRTSESVELVAAMCDEIGQLEEVQAFKRLPGHERYHTPRSEYLFKLLQPELDDDLFLGKDYEVVFDRFEVLLALANVVIRQRNKGHVWGPVGRFGWKFRSHLRKTNPLVDMVSAVEEMKSEWPPFKAGLFGTDIELFKAAATNYRDNVGKMGIY